MIEVTLSLTNEAKSDFSDVIGQDMKEKEVRVEVDGHLLGRDCLTRKARSGTGEG